MARFAWFRRPTRRRTVVPARQCRLRLVALEDRLTPATFNINDGDVAAFIAAINASNANDEPDTINLAVNGTYTFTAAVDPVFGGSALPAIVSTHSDASDVITINGNGSTLTRSTAAGTPAFRFFRVNGSVTAATLNLNDLTVTNGDAGSNRGGAALLTGGNAAFTNCTLSGNRAASGGAVGSLATGGTLSFTLCTVSSNTATGGGGGIQNAGATTITVDSSRISGNTAGASGGGILNQGGTITLTDSLVVNNLVQGSTASGGGISSQGDTTISGSSINGNHSVGSAGGIFIQGALTATDSTFANNRADSGTASGGAIFIQGALQLTQCTIDSNRAGAGGGGISVSTGAGATTSIQLCTITRNSGGDFTFATGGGLQVDDSAGGTYTLYLSVVAQNSFEAGATRAIGPDISGTIASLGYNFIGDGTGATITGVTNGNRVGTAAAPLNPLLGPLQDNGGPTLTRLPTAGSPLINNGDRLFIQPIDFDQRGSGFPRVQGRTIDIGAVEVQPPKTDVVVTKTDSRNAIAAGSTNNYTIIITNRGPEAVSGVQFRDDMPGGVDSMTWTSVASGGATGNTASGSGAISETLTLPVGATVSYRVAVFLPQSASGTLTNTATVTLTGGATDTDPSNNTATDTDTIVTGSGGQIVAVGADAGSQPLVRLFNAQTGELQRSFLAYTSAFRGGVRVAQADFNGDGIPDIVTAAGPSGGPHVKVFDGATGDEIRSFFAYDPSFTGGVFVATGDYNGDNIPDIITGAGAGGGPHVKVFSGANGALLASFMAYSPTFLGGVSVAAGDVNFDGLADIITGAGPGGAPHVQVFNAANGSVLQSFFAYDLTFHGGVFVASGDFNNDHHADIVTGPGIGGGPHVRVFSGTNNTLLFEFMAFPVGTLGSAIYTGNVFWTYGLRVATADVTGDGIPDIEVGPGAGQAANVRVFNGETQALVNSFSAFDPGFLGGVFLAGA
jgi:uncharacterized repeat protein (TIGR01451 family)